MTLKSIAAVGLLCLMIAVDILAANAINGTEGNDIVMGTDGDDEISGFDGDDELRGGAGDDTLMGGRGSDIMFGGAGDDTLMGGRGSDIMFGGSGSDNFVIDFLTDVPDEVMDFRPEEGDTLSLRLSDTVKRKIVANSIRLDAKGVVTFQLLGGKQIEAVKLNRLDLSLRVGGVGKDIRLFWTVKF
jgi:surface adhesion protein